MAYDRTPIFQATVVPTGIEKYGGTRHSHTRHIYVHKQISLRREVREGGSQIDCEGVTEVPWLRQVPGEHDSIVSADVRGEVGGKRVPVRRGCGQCDCPIAGRQTCCTRVGLSVEKLQGSDRNWPGERTGGVNLLIPTGEAPEWGLIPLTRVRRQSDSLIRERGERAEQPDTLHERR